MVKRGMFLSETKNGCALLEVDGRHYLLPMEGMYQSNIAPKAGMLVDIRFSADGAPQRVEPASTTQLEMHSAQPLPAGVASTDSPGNDLSNIERTNR